jgi:hypothetical protein
MTFPAWRFCVWKSRLFPTCSHLDSWPTIKARKVKDFYVDILFLSWFSSFCVFSSVIILVSASCIERSQPTIAILLFELPPSYYLGTTELTKLIYGNNPWVQPIRKCGTDGQKTWKKFGVKKIFLHQFRVLEWSAAKKVFKIKLYFSIFNTIFNKLEFFAGLSL